MRRLYRTDQSNYVYYVNETKDMAGEPYFAVIIPAPKQKIRRSCGKWANHKLIKEVLDDFGIDEEKRNYLDNGDVVVYGY